ncbi:hypothetical protein DRJ17_00415 [Candidatus Woesearchaeota archaeon]|nr:MAG: hypothetical protein DRJ17_00415 [Candidatus Woesearchaeota archaeon]
MIRLFGVVHGGYIVNLLSGKIEIDLEPSSELEEKLKQIPAGTRVGIENLSPEDWIEVKANLMAICHDNSFRVAYLSSTRYWDRIAQICTASGHRIIWLEDKTTWLKYVQTIIEVRKIIEKYSELDYDLSQRDHYKKLVELNEKLYRAQINSDRIHLIERDDAILRNIVAAEVQTVIAGIGHTDAWMLNQKEIKEEYGIEFGQYSTDIVVDSKFILRFIDEAIPDLNVAYDFISLRKAINFLERGRFSDEEPDLVGTWDVTKPSSGYFELFIDKRTKSMSVEE